MVFEPVSKEKERPMIRLGEAIKAHKIHLDK